MQYRILCRISNAFLGVYYSICNELTKYLKALLVNKLAIVYHPEKLFYFPVVLPVILGKQL